MTTDYFPQRRYTRADVTGFDPTWYLEHNPDVGENWQSWSQDDSSVDWRDYVRANPGLDAAYRAGKGIHPSGVNPAIGSFIAGPEGGQGEGKPGRWDWGYQHYQNYGKNEPGKQFIFPKIVGGRISPSATRNIWTGDTMDKDIEKGTFAAWHYDNFGQYETGRGKGAFKSEAAWFNSPQEQQKRSDKLQKDIADRQEKMLQDIADRADEQNAALLKLEEDTAARAARVRGRSPTGVGGAASIKGSRLSITEAGGRKGTQRFSRPTEFMNTLGIGSATPSTGKSTLNL